MDQEKRLSVEEWLDSYLSFGVWDDTRHAEVNLITCGFIEKAAREAVKNRKEIMQFSKEEIDHNFAEGLLNIVTITPPAPEEVIPDRENDRLFQDLIYRGDQGEFDENNTEPATDEVLEEMMWDNEFFYHEDRWYRDPEYRDKHK